MRILLTGGLGFIGSNTVRHLVNNGFEVVVVDKQTYAANPEFLRPEIANKKIKWYKLDICTLPWAYLLAKEKIDVVVNMAASSHVDNSIDDAKEFIDTNYGGVHSILKGIREYYRTKDRQVLLVHLSTDEVAGDLPITSVYEFTENAALLPNNPYSATKAAADLLIRAFSHTYNDINWIIVRPTNNFGPHQHLEKFIPTVVSNAVKNQSIPIYGTGGNIREWLYTLDLSEGLVKLLNLYAQDKSTVCSQVFNFGSGIRKTNLEMVCKILDVMKKPRSLITFVKDRLGHDRKYALDSKKAKDVLGWEPHLTMNFDICLKTTIEDIINRLQ